MELVDRKDILDKLTYAATNPVKDGLVGRVADWPGVNGLEALLSERLIKVARPEKFFRSDGEMPKEVELMYQIPEGTRQIGDVAAFLDELRDSVTRAEAEFAQQRAGETWSDVAAFCGRRGVILRRVMSHVATDVHVLQHELHGRASRRCSGTRPSSTRIARRGNCG